MPGRWVSDLKKCLESKAMPDCNGFLMQSDQIRGGQKKPFSNYFAILGFRLVKWPWSILKICAVIRKYVTRFVRENFIKLVVNTMKFILL